eukprot:g8766.t1
MSLALLFAIFAVFEMRHLKVLVGFLHALAEHVPQQVALAAGSQGDSQVSITWLTNDTRDDPSSCDEAAVAWVFEEICSAEVLASSGQAEISFGATVPLLQPDDVLSLGAQEMWSDDADGFPMPDGCYLQRPSNTSWTLGLVFSTAQLKPQRLYHLVLNGVLGDAARSLGQEVLRLRVMDDLQSNPFHAIEAGPGLLRSAPQEPASAFGEPDLLTAGSALRAIRGSSYMRIYLWPLLSWRLGSGRCQAQTLCTTATSGADVSDTCGEATCETFALDGETTRAAALWPKGSGLGASGWIREGASKRSTDVLG